MSECSAKRVSVCALSNVRFVFSTKWVGGWCSVPREVSVS